MEPTPSLYEINADCCWGDSCEADYWGIFDENDAEWILYCHNCKTPCNAKRTPQTMNTQLKLP